MIRLRFGHLCDYATLGQNGKLVLVGIFDNVFAAAHGTVQMPVCFLVVGLECSIGDGVEHTVSIRLLDSDGRVVLDGVHNSGRQPFALSGPGQPLRMQGIVQMIGLAVPDLGEYEFEVRVDGEHVGGVPLAVLPAPGVPPNG